MITFNDIKHRSTSDGVIKKLCVDGASAGIKVPLRIKHISDYHKRECDPEWYKNMTDHKYTTETINCGRFGNAP